MVLDKLSSSFRNSLEKITRKGVNRRVLNDVVKDIQRALLSSDVNVKLVFELTENIKKRSREKPPKGLTQKEYVINVVYEELVKFLGEEKPSIPLKKTNILLVGLFGSGKTTTAGKIASFYQKKGLKPCIVACDTYRPAAYEQLEQIGEKLSVPVFGDKNEKDSSKVLKKVLPRTKAYDVVITDSSGRDALDKDMIKEIKKLNKIMEPDEKMLILPADMGQQAGKQADAFQEALDITGVVITKLDGTAKGGGALSACASTGAKIKFIGTGENLKDLEEFDPQRFVSKLIGFGDLKGLLEKAKESGVEEKAKKMIKGKFTLEDFYEQIESMKGMGSLSQVMDMVPGLNKNKLPKGFLDLQEGKMKRFKIIMDSMTPEEKKNPDVIQSSRISRMAKGSGTDESEVRELLKMYKQSKKAMKMVKGGKRGQLNQIMKQFGLG